MNLKQSIDHTMLLFKNKSTLIKRDSWQAISVADRPEMATHELVGHSVVADLAGRKTRLYYQDMITPDLPWADDHFAERISGKPLNPPPSEEWWPHAPQGNSTFKTDGIFSHTYPERFWPKDAGDQPKGLSIRDNELPEYRPNHGIRYPYGDFNDYIALLKRDPFTRQAYFPIWFPEDTGNVSNVRTPCTLGYHLLRTGDKVDIFYFIRSCDLLRHFRNDIYFACLFLLEVLDRLSSLQQWIQVKPGIFRMHIGSLHCFRNDYPTLFGINK